jgi:integrase
MVQKKYEQLCQNVGPRSKPSGATAQASQAMRILRSLLNYAAAVYETSDGRSLIVENPVKRLSVTNRGWQKVPGRHDVIKPTELKAWYDAVSKLKNDTMTDYFVLCLFTGLRRTEAAKIQWHHIDLDDATLTIPEENVKTAELHQLPLSKELVRLFDERKQRAERLQRTSEYVFPGESGNAHIKEPKTSIKKVVKDSGVKWSMHTLRRTFATTAESLDLPYYALKNLLNHKMSGDVTAGYLQTETNRLREPMQRISDYFCKQIGIAQDHTEVVADKD